jgi:hypothetical protein
VSILIDQILEQNYKQELDAPEELDEYELQDLTADEIMNSYGLGILCQETGFLQKFAEWNSTSWSNGVPEPEYDLVRQLIRQHPDLLKTESGAKKEQKMLV